MNVWKIFLLSTFGKGKFSTLSDLIYIASSKMEQNGQE